MTRLLPDDGHPVDVVHRRSANHADSLLRYLDPEQRARVHLIGDMSRAYPRSRLFVAASSSGGLIDVDKLHGGPWWWM